MRLGIVILSCFCLLTCAKERKVEKVKDFDTSRFPKAPFQTDKIWLGKVTVVNTSEDAQIVFDGIQTGLTAGKFEITEEKLNYNNVISLEGETSLNPTLVNSWNISHSDYHLRQVNGRATNVEEENNDIPWSEKRFLKIDWTSVSLELLPSVSSCWNKVGTSLVEGSQEITGEYIGFTINVQYQIQNRCLSSRRANKDAKTESVDLKYSFIPRKTDNEYEPYLYVGDTDPLIGKYGYFITSLESKRAADGTIQNNLLMNRWAPDRTHTFYFTKDFPESYKELFNHPKSGIFAQLNQLFVRNKLATRFEILENDGTKEFGDLRYSFIKIVDHFTTSAPLGFGPSDADPFTGEIISANTVIWTGLYRFLLQRMLEDEEKKAVNFVDSPVITEMKKELGEDESQWTTTAVPFAEGALGQYFRFLLPQYTYGVPGWGNARGEPPTLIELPDYSELAGSLQGVNPELKNELKTYLDQVDAAVTETESQSFDQLTTTRYDMTSALAYGQLALQAGESLDEILKQAIHATGIHEIGHNLGLRHNFYGSVDQEHFGVDGTYTNQSNTVMEYMPLSHKKHENWGQYDEAALVYAYSSGSNDLAKTKGTTFLYCSDEHTYTNAMCNRHDTGTTPSEVAKSLIDYYDRTYWVRNFRGDRAYWNTRSYGWRVFNTFWGLKKFLKLYDQTYQPGEVTLKLSAIEGLTPEETQTYASQMQADIRQAALLSASLFGSIIQQTNEERPYRDVYDNFTGSLERKGILFDKYFAGIFLLGDFPLLYDPNRGREVASYLSMRDQTPFGEKIGRVFRKSIANPGPMIDGFDTLLRIIYARAAFNHRNTKGDGAAIDELRVTCYRSSTFQAAFGIDPNNYSAPGEPAGPIQHATIDISPEMQVLDPYFATASKVAVLNVGGQMYVASRDKNLYAYDIINKNEPVEAIRTFEIYYLITRGLIPSCQ